MSGHANRRRKRRFGRGATDERPAERGVSRKGYYGFPGCVPLNDTPLFHSTTASMRYRAEATSVEGFVQQIACCYLRHGYWFYVTGTVPEGKDPRAVDAKLIGKYGIAVSESTRRRRKCAGLANLQYVRHGRFFALMATKGKHRFFEEEQGRLRDFRLHPLRYAGYSISYKRGGRTRTGEVDTRWHAHVSIDREPYLDLRAHLLDMALRRRADDLALAFYEIRFERYAPVRRQLLLLLRRVNAARKRAGLGPVPTDALCLRRRIVRPFAGFVKAVSSLPEVT